MRRRWVALTPEEWVRQCTLKRLHLEGGYPLEVMQVEGAITLNGMTRRCDIVPYLVLTNGKQEVIIVVDFEKGCLKQLSMLPFWGKK